MIKELSTDDPGFAQSLDQLLDRDGEHNEVIQTRVREIIQNVRRNGDSALLEYTARFDHLTVDAANKLEIPKQRLQQARERIDAKLWQALQTAADRIRGFHEHQQEQSWQFSEPDGSIFGQQISPLDRVGLYVPGGKAAYPSSVLMTAIPASVAGVEEVVMVAPAPHGDISDVVLAAAVISGVNRVFTIGGAQAIAALAYGTNTVPRVDKIVGPGNEYVATAKRLVFGQVGIDMIAGPSEVVIIGDESTNPEWATLDLFAQAEHDEQAQSIFISASTSVLKNIKHEITRLLPQMERKDIIRSAIKNHGALIKTNSIDESIAVANRIAPEHLELLVDHAHRYTGQIKHAGAIFIGHHSAESLGDYCAGPNHVLPTAGTARFSSPLGVYDFQKRSSLIQCSATGAQSLSAVASTLARAEALTAHALSAEKRATPN